MTWEWQNLITLNYNLLSFYWARILFCHVSGRGFYPSDVTNWCHRLLLSHSGALSICANILHLYRFLLQKSIWATLFFAYLFEHYVASSFCFSTHTATKIPFILPEKELCGTSPNFHVHVSVSFLYIPKICSRIGKLVVEYINRSQTRECDWRRTIPFLGIFVSNFRYCVFAVLPYPNVITYRSVKNASSKFSRLDSGHL